MLPSAPRWGSQETGGGRLPRAGALGCGARPVGPEAAQAMRCTKTVGARPVGPEAVQAMRCTKTVERSPLGLKPYRLCVARRLWERGPLGLKPYRLCVARRLWERGPLGLKPHRLCVARRLWERGPLGLKPHRLCVARRLLNGSHSVLFSLRTGESTRGPSQLSFQRKLDCPLAKCDRYFFAGPKGCRVATDEGCQTASMR